MKLSHLYTNRPAIFTPILFCEGLNVILARIRHPNEYEKTGHNLGKTLLIDVIDFCLLKNVGTKDHFLKTREDLFDQLVFYLELRLHTGGYVTVRRHVRDATSISFKRHADPHQDFTELTDDKWDHVDVSLAASVKLLDSYLNLTSIKPWPYRTGVGYFMRRQADYGDEFRLSKFRGLDIHWKPYVAKVLGFDDNLIKRKYDADAEKKHIETRRDELQAEVREPLGTPFIFPYLQNLWGRPSYFHIYMRRVVRARNLCSYWAVTEMGVSMTTVAKHLISTASMAVQKGERIVREEGIKIENIPNMEM